MAARRNPELVPGEGELVVRMYRQGLGDCFLLAFGAPPEGRPSFVLIDCGVHKRQDRGPERLTQVMDDIAAATGGELDVVVATHEHADHLSGFVQKDSPFRCGGIRVKRLWAAWTEKEGDSQADALRLRRNATREAIERALKTLEEGDSTRLTAAAQCAALLDFHVFPGLDGSTAADGGAAASRNGRARGRRARPSVNELALAFLAQSGEVRYGEPGDVLTFPGAEDFRAYVLGPPRDDRLLRKDLPTGEADDPRHETYLASRADHQAFVLAPGLDDGTQHPVAVAGIPVDFRYPFDAYHRRDYRDFDRHHSGDPPRESEKHFTQLNNYFKGDSWRRIEADWLGVAETLALDLDGDTNNTSLVLAFEWGPPGAGDVFLFVGDAQVGNWESWRSQSYRAGGAVQSAEDLLSRTVLYKVGHHGSHNGTLKAAPATVAARDGAARVPFGLPVMKALQVAMIPVDRKAVDKRMPNPWPMPYKPLYGKLLEQTAGRVLRSDGEEPGPGVVGPAAVAPSRDVWQDIPGLRSAQWRVAPVRFKAGDPHPLYYDLRFRRAAAALPQRSSTRGRSSRSRQ